MSVLGLGAFPPPLISKGQVSMTIHDIRIIICKDRGFVKDNLVCCQYPLGEDLIIGVEPMGVLISVISEV